MYKVMIIDDDSTSLAIGKALLSHDYEVVTMKSGLQALGYMKNNPAPDFILLDMLMPGTSGMEVLKALKKDENLKHIPVMFLTSMDDGRFEEEGLANGADDFIQKPVVPELLKMKLRKQAEFLELRLENKRLKQKLEQVRSEVERICRDV